MEATSPWVTVIVAAIAAFGGAPLFTFLAERIKGQASVRRTERDALDREKEQLRKDREALWNDRQRLLDNERMELRTLRSAFNEVTETNGRLRGQLEACQQRIRELEAEVAELERGKT